MTTELFWLVLTTGLTSVLALPYVLNIIVRQWPGQYLRILASPPEPGADRYQWQWGVRSYGAHTNAVENLVLFATMVLAIQVTGAGNATTAIAAQVYFWARLAHAVFYTLGVPYVRTTSWMIGLFATWVLVFELLNTQL